MKNSRMSQNTLVAMLAITAGSAVVADIEEMVIVGEQREALPGSAYALDKEALQAFDYTDISRIVSQIPGLYVRDEDGFGLRPNIGIRGAAADRSQKLTLMEDAILIKPAPYSAPTAYYFPNINRMETVEVAKGPATIKYGPHSVGGAMNLVTPPVPTERIAQIELGVGSHGFAKAKGIYGDNHGDFAYWVEGFRFQSDGFKELDGGGDTGFERNDFNAKARWLFGGEDRPQALTLKLGYADETSDETYVGLTDADFAANPNRRYRGSQLDQFNSEHGQVHVLHQIEFSDAFKLNTAVYLNQFDRSWNKVDGFVGEIILRDGKEFDTQVALNTVLNDPLNYNNQIAVLRGEANTSSKAEQIDITDNDRSYASYGVQFDVDYLFETGSISHKLETGLRLHSDYVERLHSPADYDMINGNLVLSAIQDRDPKAFNKAESDAVALYITDEISWDDLTITVGMRAESIDATFDDKLASNNDNDRTTDFISPSLGATYAVTENWLLLGGVYSGFSPAGPQAPDDVDHEESLNIEYGARFVGDNLKADVIAFFSDYSNLLGRCRASDVGCVVGEEFNGGEVEVAGLELLLSYVFGAAEGIEFPVSFSYTFTEGKFQSRFDSSFSQWGLVQAGDELPYVPEHVARINAAARAENWAVNVGVSYSGEARDLPGQGAIDPQALIDSRTIVDVNAVYAVNDQLSLKLAVDNLTDEQGVVSRRPFGPRPDKPRSVNGTVVYEF